MYGNQGDDVQVGTPGYRPKVTGEMAAHRLYLHHYDTLSIEHGEPTCAFRTLIAVLPDCSCDCAWVLAPMQGWRILTTPPKKTYPQSPLTTGGEHRSMLVSCRCEPFMAPVSARILW
jgi:hypothetical protein